jgi:hypothetical protein
VTLHGSIIAAHFEGVLDFVNKAYYVEATLIAPALLAGHGEAARLLSEVRPH